MTATAARRSTKRATTAKGQSAGAQANKAQSKKPKLKVVDKAAAGRRRRQRTVLGLAATIVTVALFSVALMYGQLVEGQQDIDAMRADIAEAEAERARLEREIAVASTPDMIVARAFELGMVRALDPEYLVAVRPVGEGQ